MKGTIKIYVQPVDENRTSVSIDVAMDDLSGEDRGILVMNLMTALEMTETEQKLLGLALLTIGAKAPCKETARYEGDSEGAKQARANLEAIFGKKDGGDA